MNQKVTLEQLQVYNDSREALAKEDANGMSAGEHMGRELAKAGETGHIILFQTGPMSAGIRALSGYINEMMRARGFWDDEPALDSSTEREQSMKAYDSMKVMLVVTELAEGVEGLRKGNGPSEHIPEFSCMEEEYADAIIRILDHCAQRKWRIADAIEAKMAFNASRPHKHGKAF